MAQDVRQGLTGMQVAFMAGDTDDNVAVGGGGNRHFVAVFIGLVVFATCVLWVLAIQ